MLRTKLYRPTIPADHLHRPELLKHLDKHPDRPLVLVSAPAGYGKSTLVSCWLEECGKPSVWFSLDESDDDLSQFFSCFVEALKTLFPWAFRDTMTLTQGTELPPVTVLVTSLLNDMDRIDTRFVVVLDDIHRIKKKAVSDFLNLMLHHPSPSMQLVLIGRRDPALSIASMRAKGVITELRMGDLRFSVDEASLFLQVSAGHSIGKELAAELVQKAEGWVTGLRLAVLAMRGQDDPGRKLLELKGTTPYVMDYLISEILDRQPVDKRNFILRTAILRRFCAPLCDAVMAAGEAPGGKSLNGQAFIDWLREQNLFIIPLDTENRWFRYHHLFQDLLMAQFQRKTSPEKMAAFYFGASAWCEGQGFIEDAIHYALAVGDGEVAADIVERHRHKEFNANRREVVGRWLDRLPGRIKQHRPGLLLAEARVLSETFHLAKVPPLVERSRVLLADQPHRKLLQAELSYFLGLVSFWAGKTVDARAHLRRALEMHPENNQSHLWGQIQLYKGLTVHTNGQTEAAIHMYNSWITRQHLHSGIVWERLIFGMAMVHLLSCNLAPAFYNGQLLLEDATRNDQPFLKTFGNLLMGLVAFQRLELAGALKHFGRIIENKYAANHRAAMDSMVGFAVASELLGKSDDADQAICHAIDFARWTSEQSNLDAAYSCEARIALLRDDLDKAVMWQRGFNSPPQVPGMIFWLASPWITECRVLAASGTKKALAEAVVKLAHLRQATESLHYGCQTLEIIALQAKVAHQQGRAEESSDCLQQAVNLAEPGGWIRPFFELGHPMAGLLG